MRFIGLIFLFISTVSVGQDYPTKRQLKKFFTTPGQGYDDNVYLTISNTNDQYFNEDTIRIYNDDKAGWFIKFCQYVDWDFNEKTLTFNLIKGTTCTEPSRAIPGYLHEIKIIKEKALKILILDYSGKEVDKFKVIQLKELQVDKTRKMSQVLILVRETKPAYNKSYAPLLY